VDFSIPGTIGKTYSDERNSILAEVVLDAASGTMQRRVLANNKETKYSLKPSICSKSGRWPIILGFEESRMARYAVLRNQ